MKIKPFYVYKPSLKEAIEIVERASANGAQVYHAVEGMEPCVGKYYFKYDEEDSWGVDDENDTMNANRDTASRFASELTMTEVRAMLPCEKYDGATKEKWNGEGLPPVGTVCRLPEETEFLSLNTGLITIKPTGTKVQVIGHATRIDNGCACVVIQPVDDMDCGFSVGNHEMMIKPLITKRDEWIDKAHKTGCPINIAALLYDAGLAKDIEE